ncbi:MAG: RNA methyltransferase [Paludibacteraceae bacterium]|nr:RNA methyltransferase [Paludibacteraceae bacterium]
MSVSKANIKLVRSLQQKKFRDERGLFVAEGRKCVEELSKAFERVMLFVEGENATTQEIEQMSSLRTPQGMIGVFQKAGETLPNPPLKGGGETVGAIAPQATYRGGERPTNDSREEISAMARPGDRTSMGVIVALDGVQDPGNLGTIIRTCDWFGVRRLVCSYDTADCYNPKVVQATMGALARVQVEYVDLVSWLEEIKTLNSQPSTLPIYGTLLNGRNLYEDGAIAERQQGVIIMGNEGNGISEAVRRYITHPLLIPPYPTGAETSESLNVAIATAITLAEFRRGVR